MVCPGKVSEGNPVRATTTWPCLLRYPGSVVWKRSIFKRIPHVRRTTPPAPPHPGCPRQDEGKVLLLSYFSSPAPDSTCECGQAAPRAAESPDSASCWPEMQKDDPARSA